MTTLVRGLLPGLLRLLRSNIVVAAGAGLAAGLLYLAVGPGQQDTSSFVPLADAFLHGRTWLEGARPWEELAIRAGGGFWVPFPPFPAVALVPAVALLGPGQVDTAWASAAAGGIAVALSYGLCRDVGLGRREAAWLTVGLAIGSELLWVAGNGGHHLFAQSLAMALVFAALRLAVRRRAPVLCGVLFGCAVATRVPTIFAFPVLAVLYAGEVDRWRPDRRAITVRLVALTVPALAIGAALAAYNAARFGSPFDFGYALIVSGADQQAGCLPSTCHYPTSESWFADGIESISYIPRGLQHMLLSGFRVVPTVPWLLPSLDGMSVALTMPVLAWVARAPWRRPFVPVTAVAIAAGLALDLAHGTWGFSQIGWRFICDVLPLAWLLLASAVAAHGLSRLMRGAITWGIAVNVYITAAAWLGLAAY